MTENDRMPLIKLVLKRSVQEHLPKICIAVTEEVAINPEMLTGIKFTSYPSGSYARKEGLDLKDEAIKFNAPIGANAYMGTEKVLPVRGIMGGYDFTAVMYFRIDKQQVEKTRGLKRPIIGEEIGEVIRC